MVVCKKCYSLQNYEEHVRNFKPLQGGKFVKTLV